MSKAIPLCFLFLIIIIILLPVAMARGCLPDRTREPLENGQGEIISPAGEYLLKVFQHDTKEMVELNLEEYLVGVVAAEMPASFELEALKAQAVVARTYTVNQMPVFGGSGCNLHSGADICTDSTHCQAWEAEAKSLEKWEKNEAQAYINKIRRAVRETAGIIATYDSKPIDTVFHACCGGHTENSENVWTSSQPYLRGVKCDWCEDARWWQTKKVISFDQFSKALVNHVSVLPVSAAGYPLLGSPKRSASGRVLTLSVAGESLRGRDFRDALGLPSTNFTWQISGKEINFSIRGYGHGVGMCQYGANGQAKEGKQYSDIIHYYYEGVSLEQIKAPR